MKPIESAEEFAKRIERVYWPEIDAEWMQPFIEARDNAVRLALLDELLTTANAKARMGHDNGTACVLALVDIRAKYGAKP